MTWIIPLVITIVLWYASHKYSQTHPTWVEDENGEEIETADVWAVDVVTLFVSIASWIMWGIYG